MICKLAFISRRVILPPALISLHKRHFFLFTNQKDDENSNREEKVISLQREDIQTIKNMLKANSNFPLDFQQGQGEDFFQGQQVKLSLKLMQIDTLEQLKPIIAEYSSKKLDNNSDPNELTRCKFFILYKYINLEGSILSKDISTIFKDISLNLHHLDEDMFTIFLRLIASEQKAKQMFRNLVRKFVLSTHRSNSNSQLLSLLLMLYPQSKEDIYLHYHLKSTRRDGETEKKVVYDPINMVYIISHYFYYDDVHKLFENTMKLTSVQQSDAFLQELIRNDEDFKRRKVEALIYAISQQLHEIYSKYLGKEYFNFSQLNLSQSVRIIKSFTVSQKTGNQVSNQSVKQCCHQLIKNILSKSEALITDDQGQLQQNESFKSVSEIIASYMRKKQNFLQKNDMISLIKSVFNAGSVWKINFDMYAADELFSVIVSYKASKDFLRSEHLQLDSQNSLFASMLTAFKHIIGEADPKQLFYVCLFANQLNALSFLKSTAVIEGLREFGARKELNAAVQLQIKQIMQKFEGLQ